MGTPADPRGRHLRAVPVQDAGVRPDWHELRARLAKAVSRVCPPELADSKDDLVQVAVLRVMEVLRRRDEKDGGDRDGNRGLSSLYLTKAAYSALIDEIRRRGRRQEADLNEEVQESPSASQNPSPERLAAGRELGRAIMRCLAGLIRPRRMAVALHLRGHGVLEASRLLGWNRTRTENLVYRGLRDLRDCLRAGGFAP